MSVLEVLEYETVAVDKLQQHPNNPNNGDTDAIGESLRLTGQYKPIVVQRSTGYVLAGNHSLQSAMELGWKTIKVCWVDVDDATAERILLADNQIARLARPDDGLLASLLSKQASLVGTGYTQTLLDELLARAKPNAILDDPDSVPEPPKTPITKTGDLWLLGGHTVCPKCKHKNPVGK